MEAKVYVSINEKSIEMSERRGEEKRRENGYKSGASELISCLSEMCQGGCL